MKTVLTLLALVGILCASPATVNAESGHDHGNTGGPKGGRFLDNTEPQAEFFVEKDNTVTITFYDHALKPVAAAEQSVTVITDSKGNKSTVEFEKKDDVLVSKGALPDADDLKLVVQFKQNAEAKPINIRFDLEKGVCGMCNRAEYACTCAH